MVAYASTSKAILEIKMQKIIKLWKRLCLWWCSLWGGISCKSFFSLQMWWGLENDCDYELAQDGMHRWSDLDFYFVFAKTWKDWMMEFAPMMVLLLVWTLHKSLRCQWQSGGRKVLKGNHPLSWAFEALLTIMHSWFWVFLWFSRQNITLQGNEGEMGMNSTSSTQSPQSLCIHRRNNFDNDDDNLRWQQQRANTIIIMIMIIAIMLIMVEIM